MKIGHVAAIVAAATLTSFAAPAFAGDGSDFAGDINIKVGQKTLHKNDFDFSPGPDLSSQTGYGLLSSWGMKSWPVLVAFDVDLTSASKSGVDASTMQISLGARRGFTVSSMPIMPYVGVGISYGSATVKAGGTSNTLSGEGIWIDGGAQYIIAQHFGVGLDIRYDSCPVSKKISGTTVKADAGGFFPALTLGYMF